MKERIRSYGWLVATVVLGVLLGVIFSLVGCGDDNHQPLPGKGEAGKIVIAEVVRDGNSSLPFSVSPTKPKELAVTFAPDMVGKTVTFTIEGVNADNGTATLQGTAPITLTDSGTITVQGGTGEQQTKPGNDKQLYVKATCDGQEVGRNEGFSVCAHPVSMRKGPNYTMFNTGLLAGMMIYLEYDSDSSTPGHIDDVMASEKMDPKLYNKWGSCGNYLPNLIVGGFAAIKNSIIDTHGMSVVSIDGIIDLCDNYGGSGGFTQRQVQIFYCPRCGMTENTAVVIPNSGHLIIHEIQKGAGTRIDYKVTSRAAAVTVGEFEAQAGPSEEKADTVLIRN